MRDIPFITRCFVPFTFVLTFKLITRASITSSKILFCKSRTKAKEIEAFQGCFQKVYYLIFPKADCGERGLSCVLPKFPFEQWTLGSRMAAARPVSPSAALDPRHLAALCKLNDTSSHVPRRSHSISEFQERLPS